METPNTLKMNVLEEILHSKKITKRKLAEQLEMSHTGVNKIIRRGSVETKVFLAIADILDLHPCDLLYKMLDENDKHGKPIRLCGELNELSDEELINFLRVNKKGIDKLIK